MRRLGAAVLLLGLVGTGCQDGGDGREGYCDLVESRSEELTRTVDEGGAGAFIDLLPTLRELGGAAPSDLKDEWRTFLNALEALRDVLEDTGVEPEEVEGQLPDDLTGDERRRVRSTAALLASVEVVEAVQGIEQQALDVCHTPIL